MSWRAEFSLAVEDALGLKLLERHGKSINVDIDVLQSSPGDTRDMRVVFEGMTDLHPARQSMLKL